jgi:hypothetical protein
VGIIIVWFLKYWFFEKLKQQNNAELQQKDPKRKSELLLFIPIDSYLNLEYYE